jgi:uncharacterized membrane protein
LKRAAAWIVGLLLLLLPLIAIGYSIYFIYKGGDAIKNSHRIEKMRRQEERLERERQEKEQEKKKNERRERRLKELGAIV